MTAIAIGVTAGTAHYAPEKSGLYALYIGKNYKLYNLEYQLHNLEYEMYD